MADNEKVGRMPRAGKLYYTIGEVAEMLGERVTLVRFWENEFDFLRPHRNKKGNRLFNDRDIDRLRSLHYLIRECGMTLKGAGDLMRTQIAEGRTQQPENLRPGSGSVKTNAEVVERLKNIREMLDGIEKEL